MGTAALLLFILAVIIVLASFLFNKRKNKPAPFLPMPQSYLDVLNNHVIFYQKLNAADKAIFEQRMQTFLSQVRITGVNTTVEDTDKVFVAASAIIPIFGFPDWEYMNLNEVLLYPDSFNNEFALEGTGRDTLGMVGTGPYQNVMLLSRHALREGFKNKTGKDNTAIHEFIHLIDKTDGAVDGIPEFILSKQYILPWLNLMHKEIKNIMADHSDINPYGATNQGEFFAVVSEYFFERPDLLQSKHPELYNLLVTMFRTVEKNAAAV